ncbi:uncharacterized protein CG5098 isoform X2 [Anabrus simplex]|uniref:uncharacterized protein CG5098 isoform X2 n=1 Tax=Anabrus simplex TaxID=316456 RepID=UPI0035A39D02
MIMGDSSRAGKGTGNPASGGPYSEQQQQQRNFSSNYTHQQPPHYAPLSPAGLITTGYPYNNHHTGNTSSSQQTHHGMNYNNPQQSIYSSTVSPGHYGSPNHGQHSGYSPSSSQAWAPQQASPADYTHHSGSPQRSVVAGSSPSATPSPAHTPTSPPPSSGGSVMSGQFPAHHLGRHPPIGSPQSAQGHALPTWGHPGAGQSQGMGLHPGSGMGGPQGPGYYPPPHPSMMGPGRGMQGPPQHAHMSSAPGADRHSPHHPVVPGAWNNLGMPVTKAPGSHEVGRGPPASSHPQTNSGTNSGGPGNPLFSLQMLVNQEMNRTPAAAAAQAGSYRGQTPAAAHQQESVDLSPASGEAYQRMPQQSVPIPLTRTDKLPEHSTIRNGSIIASSASVSSTNVTSPPTPLNGEVSSDSGIGSSSGTVPIPGSLPDNSSSVTSDRDILKPKSAVESKSPVSKETVSVIAQTPPREKPKCAPQVVTTVASSSSSSSSSTSPSPSPLNSENKVEKKNDVPSLAPSDSRLDSSKPSPTPGRVTPVPPARPPSVESQERSNPIIRTSAVEQSSVSVESTSVPASSSASLVRQSEDSLSIPSPTQSTPKDSTSPVRSPKSGSLKRTKKVDSILENLVESGSKKLGSVNSGTEQPLQTPVSTVVVAPASVIVSPAVTNEDSSSGFGRDVRTPSPALSPPKSSSVVTPVHKSPTTVREEDVVSPTFSNDDVENGKPRRKRKLDKPIRVSKTSSDAEGTKSSNLDDSNISEESHKHQEAELPVEIKDISVVNAISENKVEQPTEKSVENLADDLSSNTTGVEKTEKNRRRTSSEGSSPSQSPKPANQRIRRKSASDQQDDADALLSALVSDQLDKSIEPKPEVKNAFIEVETELEKMFAGIVETDENIDPHKVEDTSSPISMEVSPTTKALETLTTLGSVSLETKPASSIKRGRPKGSRNGKRRSSESIFGPSSTDSTPKKKKKQQKRPFDDSPGTSQLKKVKRSKLFQGENSSNSRDSPILKKKGSLKSEAAFSRDQAQGTVSYDSGSNTSSSRSRGPVIHVEGPKENPYYVTVINAPSRGEDEEGNEKGGTKKQTSGTARRKNAGYPSDLEYRGKVSRASGKSLGLFSSTLSARYDAHTTDPTWICVFCKRGPHSALGQGGLGSGDLFGPYLVGKEKAEDGGTGSPFIGCEPSADEKDITEEQKRGGKNKRSLRGAEMVEQFRQKMSKKVRRSASIDNTPVLGMVPISPTGSGKDEACFEVWVHEECAVWAAGVHLVGSRIVGLQEAVWGAVRVLCSKCGEGGANVGCVRRGCEWRLHYGCALSQGWDLDEEAYIARCNQHKNGNNPSESVLPT